MNKFKKQIATVMIAVTAALGVAACDPIDDDGTVTTVPNGTDTTDPTGS